MSEGEIEDAIDSMIDEDDADYENGIIAQHVIDLYGMRPFVLPDGTLAIGVGLNSTMIDDGDGGTLFEMVDIAIRARDGAKGEELPATTALIHKWRETLVKALGMVDAALAKGAPSGSSMH